MGWVQTRLSCSCNKHLCARIEDEMEKCRRNGGQGSAQLYHMLVDLNKTCCLFITTAQFLYCHQILHLPITPVAGYCVYIYACFSKVQSIV